MLIVDLTPSVKIEQGKNKLNQKLKGSKDSDATKADLPAMLVVGFLELADALHPAGDVLQRRVAIYCYLELFDVAKSFL